jgi:hypothetical protein
MDDRKKYQTPFRERLPSRVYISEDNRGRVSILKLIAHAQNDNELITIALDALQREIQAKTDDNKPKYGLPYLPLVKQTV